MWVELATEATCRVTPRIQIRQSLSRAALGWPARWQGKARAGSYRRQSTGRATQDDAKRFDVLFCGSDSFAEIILARLIRERREFTSMYSL